MTSRKSSSASRELGACDTHQASAEERGDGVGETENLLIVRGHEDNGEPLVRELAQMAIDLGPGTDIDFASGLFDQKDRWFDAQPLAQRDFLLVTAGQFRRVAAEASVVNLEKIRKLRRDLDSRGRLRRPPTEMRHKAVEVKFSNRLRTPKIPSRFRSSEQ